MIRKALQPLLLWAVLPASLLAVAFLLHSGVLAICVYAFFLLFAAARLMTLFWLRRLEVVRKLSDDVIPVGGTVKVFLNLTNRAPWPILWNYVEETLPAKMLAQGTTKRFMFLPPGRSFHLYYSLTILQRGCHQIGPLVIEAGDVFGLFKKCRIDTRLDYVTAVPPYRVIEEFRVGQRRRLGEFTAERSVFEDPTRLRGVRDYQRGDPLKRIHWRSSAHTGALCSKVYDLVTEAGATIVLDFHRSSWQRPTPSRKDSSPPSEMAVESACAIARYLSDGGWKAGFFSNGRDPLGIPGFSVAQFSSADSLRDAVSRARAPRRDDRLAPIHIPARAAAEQFPLIHENLGRIELSDGLPIEVVLLEGLPHIEREQVLVFITGEVSEPCISGLLRVRALGYRLMVFVICNPEAFDRASEALAPHGIEVFDTNEEWRLEEIAIGRRHF
jgi:uncharacterized protein (DUF58 family)